MLTPVLLWACCLLSCLSIDTFIFFFLSTTVKSASSFCTAIADCGLSALPPNTLANVGDEEWGGSGEGEGRMAPVESRGTAVMRGGGVEGWVGSAGVGGAGVWGWCIRVDGTFCRHTKGAL